METMKAVGIILLLAVLGVLCFVMGCVYGRERTQKNVFVKRAYIPRWDKNGIQLREGDVVQLTVPKDFNNKECVTERLIVEYDDEICGFTLKSKYYAEMLKQGDFEEYKAVIVGNVYENPHLALTLGEVDDDEK